MAGVATVGVEHRLVIPEAQPQVAPATCEGIQNTLLRADSAEGLVNPLSLLRPVSVGEDLFVVCCGGEGIMIWRTVPFLLQGVEPGRFDT